MESMHDLEQGLRSGPAIPALERQESARETDADFHDGWQPIRLRQATKDGER